MENLEKLKQIISDDAIDIRSLLLKIVDQVEKDSTKLERDTYFSFMKEVCNEFNVPYFRLIEKTRKREVSLVRQVILFYIYQFDSTLSLREIADKFDLTHTMPLAASRNVINIYETDKEFKKQIDYITSNIASKYFNVNRQWKRQN